MQTLTCPRQRRSTASRRGRAAPAAGPFHPRDARPDRHAHRLRHHQLRRLHGPLERPAGQVLHRLRRPGRRRRDRHRRRAGARRRAAPDPGRFLGGARPAVRLLHPRHDDDGGRAAGREPRSRARTRSARRSPATSAAAPATSTSCESIQYAAARCAMQSDRRIDQPGGRRRQRRVGRRRAIMTATPHPGHRPQGPKRKEDPALHSRAGHLRRRREAARHALSRHRAQPVRPRQHPQASTPRRRWRCRACWRSSPARTSKRPAWPGCRR